MNGPSTIDLASQEDVDRYIREGEAAMKDEVRLVAEMWEMQIHQNSLEGDEQQRKNNHRQTR